MKNKFAVLVSSLLVIIAIINIVGHDHGTGEVNVVSVADASPPSPTPDPISTPSLPEVGPIPDNCACPTCSCTPCDGKCEQKKTAALQPQATCANGVCTIKKSGATSNHARVGSQPLRRRLFIFR